MSSNCKALLIQRHDTTARDIIEHIRKGKHGGYYVLADVGNKETLAAMGVTDKHKPQWILPKPSASRMDIMLVHVPPAELPDAKGNKTLPAKTHITAIEQGYRGDHDHEKTKEPEKLEQHKDTCERLHKDNTNLTTKYGT